MDFFINVRRGSWEKIYEVLSIEKYAEGFTIHGITLPGALDFFVRNK